MPAWASPPTSQNGASHRATKPRTALIFPAQDGQPWSDSQFRNWRARVYVPTAERVGVVSPRPYDLRHGFASLLLREGVSPVEIAEELGHSLATLLAVYSHVIRRYRGKPSKSAEHTIRQARLSQELPNGCDRDAGG
ncbi:MAG: tyrosine-type recombinase/integrase [Gaiellaceae bacterium]